MQITQSADNKRSFWALDQAGSDPPIILARMSQGERNREIGSLVNKCLETRQELACLQGRVSRIGELWELLQQLLLGAELGRQPDMREYPSREEVEELSRKIPEAKRKLEEIEQELQSSGVNLA